MTPQEAIQKLALKCRYDLYFLCKYVLGYDIVEEDVHGDLCAYVDALLPNHLEDYFPPETKVGTGLEDAFNPKNRNLMILMPRGTLKTSIVTIGFTLQVLLNEPNARVLLDTETSAKAKAFLSEIKGHLEKNEIYRIYFHAIHGVYPDGVSTKRNKDLLWTNNEIVVASRTRPLKEPSVMGSGVDKAINGLHFDYIISDDLHSEKNVTNKEQIQQVIDHWKLNYSLLDPGKVMIVIGTRWDYNDVYQEILDKHRDDYNIMIRRAIKDDGTAFYPTRLPLEELSKIKEKMGASHFSNQYMNEPVSEEDATFKRSDIIYKDWALVKDMPINWYLLVDPSFEGPYSDYAGIIVVGMDFQKQLYVRHILRKKLNFAEIIDAVFDLNTQYRPKIIAMKIVGQAKSLMYEMNNEQRRRGTWLPIRELRDNKHSKEDRIKALAPVYNFHHAFHIKGATQLDELEYEMLHFPRAKHDDILDAYASVLEIATAPNPTSNYVEDEDGRKVRRSEYVPRSFITNV